jgi:acetyltransferase-like isoleucine patch superfamily enzyme
MAGQELPWESLERQLHELYQQRDDDLRQRFDRSLPFADGVFDRWTRAKRLGFADGASLYNSAAVFGSVAVGENTWIGPYVILDGSGGGVGIGRYCSISAGVHVYTHDTMLWALSGGTVEKRTGSVNIGDSVYIGSQSVISCGVTIGSHCVIGCNSYVTGDVPSGSVFAGSPARRIGRVVGVGSDVRVVYD